MGKANVMDSITKAIDTLKSLDALTDGVLAPIDIALESDDGADRKRFSELLNAAEEKIRKTDDPKTEWWLAEIYLRKARCARGVQDRKREYGLWKDARNYARISGNHEMDVQSSLELGFSFADFTGSLREILEIQMDCLKAICAADVATISRLRIIGINLFDFWRQLEYRRLSEHDLKAKQYIVDSAKSLQSAGFDDEAAAPLMVLLISRVYDFEDPAIEWARMETSVLHLTIPEDVKRKIE